jgi:hypothetical protein
MARIGHANRLLSGIKVGAMPFQFLSGWQSRSPIFHVRIIISPMTIHSKLKFLEETLIAGFFQYNIKVN